MNRKKKSKKGSQKPKRASDDTPLESFGKQDENDIYFREGHPELSGIDTGDSKLWKNHKLVIVGDAGVGKTSLLLYKPHTQYCYTHSLLMQMQCVWS